MSVERVVPAPPEAIFELLAESWDLSQDHQRLLLKLGPLPERSRVNKEKTAERIEKTLAG